jgi:ABC-type uncharacterized transport system ATPase subunit
VRAGEIVGVAGVSGNGQRELMEALVGQRPRRRRGARVGQPYPPPAKQNRRLKVRSLPEEPLRNACVGELSVAAEHGAARLRRAAGRTAPRLAALAAARARPRSGSPTTASRPRARRADPHAVRRQRAARRAGARAGRRGRTCCSRSNPVFGLDFAAVAEIHGRLMQARDRGAAVLLVSEDLDELLELADRIVVMSEGASCTPAPAPTGRICSAPSWADIAATPDARAMPTEKVAA